MPAARSKLVTLRLQPREHELLLRAAGADSLSDYIRRMVLAPLAPPADAKERCPCGKMTLLRAMARGRSSAHKAGCRFYPLPG